jgi:hypothetical protein
MPAVIYILSSVQHTLVGSETCCNANALLPCSITEIFGIYYEFLNHVSAMCEFHCKLSVIFVSLCFLL